MPYLVDQIEDAFGDVQHPGDDHLTVYNVEGRAYDATFQLLRRCDWRHMPVKEFIRGDTPIPDLTPEAFHYYLPALLLACFDEMLAPFVTGSVLFFLDPQCQCGTGPLACDRAEFYQRFVGLFSRKQCEAVVAVLRALLEQDQASDDEVRSITGAFLPDQKA